MGKNRNEEIMLELSQLQSAATQPPHPNPKLKDATEDQSALPEDIYFQPIDTIVEYANKNGRIIKRKVLDIYSSGIILRLFYRRLNGIFKRCFLAENLKYGSIFLRFPRSPSFKSPRLCSI